LDGLRSLFENAGFSVERVQAELGVHELPGGEWERAAQRRRLAGGGAFEALAHLFLLEEDLDAADLDRALRPLGVDGLVKLGLCSVDGGRARAAAKLVPHGDYILACDAGDAAGPTTLFDHVPGVQGPSVTLAKLAVRRPAGSALDLGTGLGLQALLAAKHCGRVVATDINPRALRFAEFNSRLNRVDNIELRLGWGFDPVGDERFDVVVANLPYVISPDHAYAFRDSDIPGDEMCRTVVEQLPGHLNEGGFGHVLVSWAYDPSSGWDAPLRRWVTGRNCDAWLLHYRTSDPLSHALGWLRPLSQHNPAQFEAALDRWLAYLGERGIEAIGHGAVVVRRREGAANWQQSAPFPIERLEPASDHIQRVFAAGDLLADMTDDQALLGQTFRLCDHHQVHQTLVSRNGSLETKEASLELTDGLRYVVGLDRYSFLLLPFLDGSGTLAEALEAAASRLALTPEGRQQFVPAALPAVRRLLELGFLDVLGPRG
jgi:methylase of polypeptide subunit release factors